MFLEVKSRRSLWLFVKMLVLILILALAITVSSSETIKDTNTSCIEKERQALLSFRNGIDDDADLLSSWSSEDRECCRWIGVHCSQKTGHITALHLSSNALQKNTDDIDSGSKVGSSIVVVGGGSVLGGEIGPSLLNLTYLRYLDLSHNNFSRFPAFIGSLNGLKYLNFYCSYYSDVVVPPQLGNLSRLEYLDFGCEDHNVRTHNLTWASRLSSLKYLHMTGFDLGSVPSSFKLIMNLPSLVNLELRRCTVSIPSSPSNFNSSSSLEVIHITDGEINSVAALFKWLNISHKLVDLTIPELEYNLQEPISLDVVGTLTSLEHLDLSGNDLDGEIPMSWGNLCNLQTLDLSNNRLNGNLNFFQNWSRCPHPHLLLREFSAASNEFSGSFDFTKFTSLEDLDVSGNSLNGSLSDRDMSKLRKLKKLDLSSNSFTLNLDPNWIPPFQLNFLDLSNCRVGPAFPNWIRTQENIFHLGISSTGISGIIPSLFWDTCDRLKFFDISQNKVGGRVPSFSSGIVINLSNNFFGGSIPEFSSNILILDLSKNNFSGNISSLCTQESGLFALDLSSNQLSGYLPDCWMNYQTLSFLDLSSNNFWGTIPGSMGTLSQLYILNLSSNSLLGKLPSSLNSLQIEFLSLRENQLSGDIPTWIGSLTELVVLELQSNNLGGSIPKSLCLMKDIQVLDLSLNNFSGTLPTCLGNLSAMAQKTSTAGGRVRKQSIGLQGLVVEDEERYINAWVTWKGKKSEYQRTLGFLKLIDLSSNKLNGEIPAQLGSLYGLISMNLSRNDLTGSIPGVIGQLQLLDALDLSNNHLSGKIPGALSNISRLNYLDLSNNNLCGRIPSSTQMQTFNANSFAGNPGLCGLPLLIKCPGDRENSHPPSSNHGSADGNSQEDEKWYKNPWFYGSIALGYTIGFWGVCGPLVLYSPFRQAYFQFLDRMKDSLLLAIALKRAKSKTWLL